MAWSGGNNAAPQGGLMGDQSAPLIHSWNSLQPSLLLVNTSFPFTWKHAAIVYIFTPLHLPTLPYRSLLTVNPVPPAQPWPHSNSTVILNALLKSCQRRFHLVKSYAKLNSTLNSMLFSHSFVQLFDSMDWSMPGLPVPHQLPELCSKSCTSSRWCHPTISFSVIPFSSRLQSFPALGSFQMSQLFTSGGQNIGVSASASVLPVNIQDWFPLGWTGWISLQSKDSQESSPTPQFKSINSSALITFRFWFFFSGSVGCSIVSNSVWLHGSQHASLLCPWDSPGKNTGVGSQLWCPDYLGFLFVCLFVFAKTPAYPSSSLTSLEKSLRAMRGHLPSLCLQYVCWIKHSSQLVGCAFFQLTLPSSHLHNTLMLCGSSLYRDLNNSWQHKLDHVTLLFKILQWLLSTFRIKLKYLPWPQKKYSKYPYLTTGREINIHIYVSM